MTGNFWLTQGRFIAPRGVIDGALKIERGRIGAIRARAPKGARSINVRGAYVAPGFIDLHVWGEPAALSRELARGGTSAFLTSLGPEPPARLLAQVRRRAQACGEESGGAACLGIHLEGPFLNPARAGVLPPQGMRKPSVRELAALARAAKGRLRLITLAPELPGALEAIRWCASHRVMASLGHSEASEQVAHQALKAGARAVTHLFNAMPPLHHRAVGLAGVALTEPRLVAMVIADGVHVSAAALKLLVRAKGADGVALVTDSIAHQGWDVVKRGGAYYDRRGVLAGSALTIMAAVENMARLAGASIVEAVHMASAAPARLLGLRDRGAIEVGKRADLVVFDERFCVKMTIVNGRVVYQSGA